MSAGWAVGCIVVAAVLITGACVTVPPLRRRRRPVTTVSAPAAALPAGDYPTERIPVVPALEQPRLMLRPDELLWHKGAEDSEGVITLGLLPAAAGQLGVLMDVDGEALGVRLDRHEVQGLRDALTCHLVDTAKPVRS